MIDYFTIDDNGTDHDLHGVTAGLRMLDRIDGLLGFPSPRDTSIDRPEGDGVIESLNQYVGPKTPVLEGCVFGTVDTIASAYANWVVTQRVLLAAVRTPKLCKWRSTGSGLDLQSYMRVAGPCAPKLGTDEHGAHYRYQVVLRAADPFAYSQTSQSASVIAPVVTTTGMPLPIIFPIPFATIGTGGTIIVTAGGNAPSWPIITIDGPINGPVISNATQGKSVFFEGLNLAAGEQLIVNMNPNSRTATVAGASQMGAIRYADSAFFNLTPGIPESIIFYGIGLGYTVATQMTVAWRDTYTG